MPSPNQIHVQTLTTEYTGIPQMITSPIEIAPAPSLTTIDFGQQTEYV